jgi:hypothetical protein
MTIVLVLLGLVVNGALGYLIWLDYRAHTTFTPGELAIFAEMRRVLEDAGK